MHVYQSDTGPVGYCFVCRTRADLSKENLPVLAVRGSKKEPTDILDMLDYINTLAVKKIRGLELPYDDYGYYIQWPNAPFYKRRNWIGSQRYSAPNGHKAPLYIVPGLARGLILIEGELNALTLVRATTMSSTVCSPGSASNFMRYYSEYLQYSRVMIVCDFDAAGVVFAHQLKEKLLSAGKHVSMNPVHKDFNQTLQDGGPAAVIEQFKKLVR